MVKYIEIDGPSKDIGHKNLLHAQLELLQVSKRISTYSSLRKKEFNLKSIIKKKFSELQTLLLIFEKSLPNVKNDDFARTSGKNIHSLADIENEIDLLKNRIDTLNSE